jgi:hypothetical protein
MSAIHPELDTEKNDIGGWLKKFEAAAGDFRWYLAEGGKLRTRIEGCVCCPLQAYAYHVSSKHIIPDSRHMANAANCTDRQAVVVIQHADDLWFGRYFKDEVRQRLLKACLPEPSGKKPFYKSKLRDQEEVES